MSRLGGHFSAVQLGKNKTQMSLPAQVKKEKRPRTPASQLFLRPAEPTTTKKKKRKQNKKKKRDNYEAVASFLDNGQTELQQRLATQHEQVPGLVKKAKPVKQSGKTARMTQAYRMAPAPMDTTSNSGGGENANQSQDEALAQFRRELKAVIRNNGIESLTSPPDDESGDRLPEHFLQHLAMDESLLEGRADREELKKKLAICGSEFPAQIVRAEQLARTREQGMAIPHPPKQDAINYAQRILNRSMANSPIYSIAVRKGLQLPKLPKLTRIQIANLLKPANASEGERPCAFGPNCVSVDMARKREAPNAYPCKEMRLPNLPKPNGEHTKYMCYLCSVYMTTRLYGQNVTNGKSVETIVQPFQVICGVEGEYHINSILPLPIEMGAKFFGLFAPFPRWDATNYEWTPQGWLESSQLDFRAGAMHH